MGGGGRGQVGGGKIGKDVGSKRKIKMQRGRKRRSKRTRRLEGRSSVELGIWRLRWTEGRVVKNGAKSHVKKAALFLLWDKTCRHIRRNRQRDDLDVFVRA